MKIQYMAAASWLLLLGGCGGSGGTGGEDTRPPTVTAPADITVEAVSAIGISASNAEISTFLAASSATDSVDGANLTFSHDGPSIFPLGATTVTFTYTDTSGNVGSASSVVNVVDTTAPIVTAPLGIVVEAPGTTEIASFLSSSSATDIVDDTLISSNDAPASFSLGITIVTFSFTDDAGNTGTSTATVTLNDTIAPMVTAPSDLTVEAAGPQGVPASNSSIVNFLNSSSGVDAGDSSLSFSQDAPAAFPLGDTLVTFIYTDWAGNVGTDAATVSVLDTIAPVLSILGNSPFVIEQYSTFIDPGTTVSDIVDQAITVTSSGLVDTSIPGNYDVTYNASDSSGNAASPVTRSVIVEEYSPRLDALEISRGGLDQIFQVNQLIYTASVYFHATRIRVTPTSSDVNTGVITVNGVVTPSGQQSDWIYLAEGENTITIAAESSDTTETRSYTLTITRLSLQASLDKLFSADGAADDRYGHSIAMSGDTLAVGAYLDDDSNAADSGSVYVYTRNAGVWSLQQKLTASDAAIGAGFGASLALENDTLIIGAYRDDDNGQFSGSVYVFTRIAGAWSENAKITPADGAATDQFGVSVSLDGDTLAIGAFQDDGTGSVYVYTRTAGAWSEQDKVTASDASAGDAFGGSVSLRNGTLAVGAQNVDDGPSDNNGAVYIFTHGAGVWSEQARILNPQIGDNDRFGSSISLSGESLAVGCPRCAPSVVGTPNAGVVYVYTRDNSIWSEQAVIEASNPELNDQFGWSVSISGDTLAVGNDTDGGNAGAAYLFTREAGIWTEQEKILAPDGAVGERFGWSVFVLNNEFSIGATFDDANGSNSGSVYVFK